jgi:hypothetical protein
MTLPDWVANEAKERAWRIEQARRVRNNKIEALLDAYGMDRDDLVEWIKDHVLNER